MVSTVAPDALLVCHRLLTQRLANLRWARREHPHLVPEYQRTLDVLLDQLADHYRQTPERTR